MARPGVPYEVVAAYVEEQSRANGSVPSIASIIAECGGSATTITKYRQRYLGNTNTVNQGEPLPAPFEEAIRQNALSLWGELLVGLEQRESTLEDGFQQKMKHAEAIATESKRAQHDAEIVVEQVKTSIEDYKKKLEAATTENRKLNRELSDTNSTLAAQTTKAESAASQLDALKLSTEQVKNDHDNQVHHLRDQIDKMERAHNAALRDLNASHDALIKQYVSKESEMNASYAQLQAQAKETTKENNQLSKSIQSLKHAKETLTLNLGNSQKTIDTLGAQNSALKESLKESEKDFIESRSTISTLEIQLLESNKSHERQLESERATISRYEIQVSSLERKMEDLNEFIKKHAVREKS